MLLVAQAIWGKKRRGSTCACYAAGGLDFGERMSKLLACLRLEGSREIDKSTGALLSCCMRDQRESWINS
jgi:hypothetical protein